VNDKELIERAINQLPRLDKEQTNEVYRFKRKVIQDESNKFRRMKSSLIKKLTRILSKNKMTQAKANTIMRQFHRHNGRKLVKDIF